MCNFWAPSPLDFFRPRLHQPHYLVDVSDIFSARGGGRGSPRRREGGGGLNFLLGAEMSSKKRSQKCKKQGFSDTSWITFWPFWVVFLASSPQSSLVSLWLFWRFGFLGGALGHKLCSKFWFHKLRACWAPRVYAQRPMLDSNFVFFIWW